MKIQPRHHKLAFRKTDNGFSLVVTLLLMIFLSQMNHYLNSKHKDHPDADGKMTEEQKKEYLKKYEAELITPAEAALWKRGASNAGYHYLGCAKTLALMGRYFAEANYRMIKQPKTK